MKNKLQLSNKINLRQQWLFASFGIGAIAVVVTVIFVYLNLGNSEKAVAAGEETTCAIIIASDEVGDGNNFKPYKVKIEADIIRVVPNKQNCIDGYNFNIEVAYNISFEGPGKPNINTLQGNIICDNYNLWFAFPDNVMKKGGSGTFVTTFNPWRDTPDCASVTPETLGCDAITIIIEGEGIPRQTNLSCPKLLPISLLDFGAKKEEDKINVQWSTAAEINNDFFTLERSNDGKTFETIATIEGAGNSNQKIDYEFEDKNPIKGYNYYRLKQTDYNGDFEYFNIVVVNNEKASKAPMDSEVLTIRKAYPNPFKNEINLSFDAQAEKNIEVIIQDSRGDVVYSESVAIHHGTTDYKFSKADKLAAGVYYISIKGNTQTYKPQRIVKL